MERVGIGSGLGSHGISSVNNMTIKDGDFISFGAGSAGIGYGNARSGESFVGTISILNGRLNATDDDGGGAEIGSGYSQNGNSSVDQIPIRKGIISAIGTRMSADIGSGDADSGQSLSIQQRN
jgi:hypothetical protein